MNTSPMLSLRELFPSSSEISRIPGPPEPVHQRRILIDGELQEWTGPCETVLSAVCEKEADGSLKQIELGSYPIGRDLETLAALDAATTAYDSGSGAWPTMTAVERIGCVENFTRQILVQRHKVVELLMWEIGKSKADSEKEFDRTIEYIRATIEALKAQDNENSRFQVVDGTIGQVRRTPLGVVLCMGPYNYPLNETFATLIPALIMGNTVVLKPPRYGILLYEPLLEAFRTAFPRGVVNFVYGKGSNVVPLLLESGKIKVLSLIGSSKVADHLKKLHPKIHRLRSILGLDAKNAAIVLKNADLKIAVQECLSGALSFNGQRCTALKMLLVEREIVARFNDLFVSELNKLKIGMPWENDVRITPLPDTAKVRLMTDLVEDAKSKGAKVINDYGGNNAGTLYYPAVVFPVTEDMRLYREEQFGPIVPIMPFDDLQVALDYVVSSEHGQQVSIFGSDAAQIGSLVDPLVNQVCRVNINCQCQRGPDVFPFTGRKDSAEGTLSVVDALRSFSIRSMIAIKGTAANKSLLGDILQNRTSRFINTDFIL